MKDESIEELWRLIDLGEVLFEGSILKRSEVLGWWNPRHIRIVRAARGSVLCLYWSSSESSSSEPRSPRGILDGSNALLSNNASQLEIEIRHAQDLLRDHDCFGSRDDLVVVLRAESMETFESLCGALGGAVAAQAPFSTSTAQTYEKEKVLSKDLIAKLDGSDGKKEEQSNSRKERLEQEYEMLGELGKGAFSTVYRARHISGDQRQKDSEVAVKVVTLDKMSSRERKTQLRYLNSEVGIMKRIKEAMPENKNVVQMLDCFAETRPHYRVSMVLELCTGGELFDRIVQRNFFSEKDAKKVIRDLASALVHLHSVGIVHRDIKPENLIYDSPAEDATIKITDFGLALDMNKSEEDVYKSHVVGTCGYFAPEVLSLRYGPPCDVWSLGVVLYILLCGYPPFAGKNRLQVQKEIRLGRYHFHMPEWAGISLAAQDLVSKMLEYRPRFRIRPDQVLEHQWLTSSHTTDSDPISLTKHRQFNHKRKLKAAAYAVIWGARLSGQRKERLQSLQKKLRPNGFKSEDLELIKQAFDRHATRRLSSDGHPVPEERGLFDTAQLRDIMKELGYKTMPLERLFELFDGDGDGKIDQKELLAGLAALQGLGEESLRFCFSVYDKDGSGEIDKDELGKILSTCITNDPSLNPDKISRELSEAFEEIDTDGDGTISFPEFKKACQKKPYLVKCLLSRKLSQNS